MHIPYITRSTTLILLLIIGLHVAFSTERIHAAPQPQSDTLSTFRSSAILFVENVGQFAGDGQFVTWGGREERWFTDDAIWLSFSTPATFNSRPRRVNVRLSFVGANDQATLEPFEPLDTTVSFFAGNSTGGWHAGVPAWNGVRYADLYPGISLEITSSAGQFVHRLVAEPGADLSVVQMQIDGVNSLGLVDDGVSGDLHAYIEMSPETAGQSGTIDKVLPLFTVVTPAGAPWEGDVPSPSIERTQVRAPFAAPGSGSSTGSGVNVVAPAGAGASGFGYSMLLGGNGTELGDDIAVDSTGAAYVSGSTSFATFPTEPGIVFRDSHSYALLFKIDPSGRHLVYMTLLASGGSGLKDLVLDSQRNLYLAGYTSSLTYPTTPNAYNPTHQQSREAAYVSKISAAGDELLFSTFLGWGPGRAYAVAVDADQNVYVTGTGDAEFPNTTGSQGPGIFVAKLTPDGSALTYSTMLGGSGAIPYAMTVDDAGQAYVTGSTSSPNFPVTADALDRSYNGGESDAFWFQLSADGSQLLYSTYLGGSSELGDAGRGIAVDGAGNVYISGDTVGQGFPTTPGAYSRSLEGIGFFAAKFSPQKEFVYGTFLGEVGGSALRGMAIDAAGSLYVTGSVGSLLRATSDAVDASANGGGDAFSIQLSADGSAVSYATYLGGSRSHLDFYGGEEARDIAYGIDVDAAGNIYMAGYTDSIDFPTTSNAFSQRHSGNIDMFVTKLQTATSFGRSLQPAPALPATEPSTTEPLPAQDETAALPEATLDSSSDARMVVLVDRLNIRTGPGTEYSAIGQVNTGDVLDVLEHSDDGTWCRICCVGDQVGWVINEPRYVRLETNDSTAAPTDVPTTAPTAAQITATPVPPPTSVPATACTIPIHPDLRGLATTSEMGCPANEGQITWAAWQPFQGGQMVWRRDTDAAYYFYNGGTWGTLTDRWSEGVPIQSRGAPPPGLQAPVRGFGYVWGLNDALFNGLGWATDEEKGFCALTQDFDNGFALRSSTAQACHEEGLYNYAGEDDFGLRTLKAHTAGYWGR